MPREAKVGGGVWHEYILLLKKKKKTKQRKTLVVSFDREIPQNSNSPPPFLQPPHPLAPSSYCGRMFPLESAVLLLGKKREKKPKPLPMAGNCHCIAAVKSLQSLQPYCSNHCSRIGDSVSQGVTPSIIPAFDFPPLQQQQLRPMSPWCSGEP